MKQYFVGVDLGSSNVVMVVGSRAEGSDSINIEGISVQSTKKSIKQGRICTSLSSAVPNLSSAILAAKHELEEELGIKIEQGYFGLGDSNTRCVIVEDILPVKNKKTGVIGNEDITILRHMMRQIKTESCAEGVWEISPLCYFVNGTKQTLDPVGMQGSWLKGRYMLTVGMNDQINSLKQMHHKLGIEIQNIFVTPLITYPLLVSKSEAQKGVVVVDMGSEVTDVTIIRDGKVQYFYSLPVGAELIDSDLKSILAKGSNVTKIKHLYGESMSCNVADNEIIKDGNKEIIRRNIATVIEARVMDIAELVGKVIDESGLSAFLDGGIVLTGGCSSLKGIDSLFERELNRPCRKADVLYGVGSKPSECEITPGQHAAVAIMLHASQYQSSYVRELDQIDFVGSDQEDIVEPAPVTPVIPVTPVTEPADETIDITGGGQTPDSQADTATDNHSADVDGNGKDQGNAPVKKQPTKKNSKGVISKLFGNLSRFMGGDEKEK